MLTTKHIKRNYEETPQYYYGILKGFEIALQDIQNWLEMMQLMAENSIKYIRKAEGRNIVTEK